MVWRTLRVDAHGADPLLLMLALASVVGSLVPQWPNSPERVVQYQLDHPLDRGVLRARRALRRLAGPWWFVLIAALLFVSLVGVPVPADPRAGADAPAAAHAGARDRRVPAVRGAGGARGCRA